jgi:hypothetical protein
MAKIPVPVTQDDIDATNADNVSSVAPDAGRGVRSVRAFQMKSFLPNADWINRNVVAQGKGTQVLIGRIYGIVTGVSEKQNVLPNGELATSIVTQGLMESESYLTGEMAEANGAFLPGAISDKFKAMFAADEHLRSIEIDLDIGVEATGKSIPYTWVVIQHVEGEKLEPLKRLRKGRGRPVEAAQLVASAVPKQLTAG